MRNILIILLFNIFLVGCLAMPTKEVSSANARPDWIDNPGNGASASAGTNVYGKIKQEETAIARARAEFAKRQGVKIIAGQDVSTSVANGRANTTAQSDSHEYTEVSDVKAVVKAKWWDVDRDVIWVWVVPSN